MCRSQMLLLLLVWFDYSIKLLAAVRIHFWMLTVRIWHYLFLRVVSRNLLVRVVIASFSKQISHKSEGKQDPNGSRLVWRSCDIPFGCGDCKIENLQMHLLVFTSSERLIALVMRLATSKVEDWTWGNNFTHECFVTPLRVHSHQNVRVSCVKEIT